MLETSTEPQPAARVDNWVSGVDNARCGFGGASGVGNGQPLDSLVRIPGGWKRMGGITVGQDVCAARGGHSVVVEVSPHGRQPVYRVTFHDGRDARATANHLWQVHCKCWSSTRWVSTEKIRYLLAHPSSYGSRLYVPLLNAEVGREAELPIDPYVLGVLLGDGSLADGQALFTTADAQIADSVRSKLRLKYSLTALPSHLRYSIVNEGGYHRERVEGSNVNYYKESLKSLGLSRLHSYDKFVPQPYLDASHEQRLELLRGLLDTDGTVGKKKSVSYCTTSEQLAKQVQEMVWSLGGLCHIGTKRSHWTYKGEIRQGRRSYCLSIRHPRPDTLFSLDRKRERASRTQYSYRLKLLISSVEPDGEAECQSISVSHPGGLYITDHYVVTHNSASLGYSAKLSFQ